MLVQIMYAKTNERQYQTIKILFTKPFKEYLLAPGSNLSNTQPAVIFTQSAQPSEQAFKLFNLLSLFLITCLICGDCLFVR